MGLLLIIGEYDLTPRWDVGFIIERIDTINSILCFS